MVDARSLARVGEGLRSMQLEKLALERKKPLLSELGKKGEEGGETKGILMCNAGP